MGLIDAVQRKLQKVGGTKAGDKLLSIPTKKMKRKSDSIEAPDLAALLKALINQVGQSQPVQGITQADRAVGEAMGPAGIPTKIGRGIGKAVAPMIGTAATFGPEMAFKAGGQGALRATDPNMEAGEKAWRMGAETAIPMATLLGTGALVNALPAASATAPFARRLATNAMNMAPTGFAYGLSHGAGQASAENQPFQDVAKQGLKEGGIGAGMSAALGAVMTPFGVNVGGKPKKPMTEAEYEARMAEEVPLSARERALAGQDESGKAIYRPELKAQEMQERAQRNAEVSESINRKFDKQKGFIDPNAKVGGSEAKAKSDAYWKAKAMVEKFKNEGYSDEMARAKAINEYNKAITPKGTQEGSFAPFDDMPIAPDEMPPDVATKRAALERKFRAAPENMQEGWSANIGTQDPKMIDLASQVDDLMLYGNMPRGEAEKQILAQAKMASTGTQEGFFTPFGDVKAVGKGKTITAEELAGGQEISRKIGNIEIIFNGGEDGDSLYVALGKKKLSPEVAQQIAEASKQSGLSIEVGNPATSGGFSGMGDWYDEPAEFLKAYGGGKKPKPYTYKPNPKQVSTMKAFIRKAKSLGRKTWQDAAGEADYTEDLFYKNLNYDATKDALVTPQGDFGASDKGADKMIDLMRQYEIAKQALSKKKIGGSQSGFIDPFGSIGQSIDEGASIPDLTGKSSMAKEMMRTPQSEPAFEIQGGPELGGKTFHQTLNEPFNREKTSTGNFDKLLAEQFKKEAGKRKLDKADWFRDFRDSLGIIQTYSDIANEKIPQPERASAIDNTVQRFRDMIVKNHDITARDQFIYLPNVDKPSMKGKEINVLTYLDEVLNTKDPIDKVIKFDALANAQHQRGNIVTMDLDLHATGPVRTRINGAVKNWLDKLRDYRPNVTQAVENQISPQVGRMPQAGFMQLPEGSGRAIADTLGFAALPAVAGGVARGAKAVSGKIGDAFNRRFK